MMNHGSRDRYSAGDLLGGALLAAGVARSGATVRGCFTVHCRAADGTLRWEEEIENIVVTEGLNELLNVALCAATQTTTWYVGLKNTGAPAASDVMASHSGWTENTTYSNANRPAWTPGTVSAGSVNNSGSVATFTVNGSTTIFGAFITSNNTKGGTTGKLYSAGDFSASRAVISGDSLLVTYTVFTQDDGV